MTPREKAEACFAKARSTTSTHERDNAVTLGTRVAEKAGLDLDTFDIPGRVRKVAPRSDGGARDHGHSNFYAGFDDEKFAEMIRRATRTMREQQEELSRQRGRARAATNKPRPLYPNAEAASAFLRSIGCVVQAMRQEPGQPRRWSMMYGGRLFTDIDDAGLINGALKVTPPEVKAQHAAKEQARMARDDIWNVVWG